MKLFDMSGLGPDFTTDEIRTQLLRLTDSSRFRNKPTLSPLLAYLLERKLAGATNIKQRELAEKVWDRKEFDPDDTFVRTAASDLRTQLREYCENEGKANPITILMPPKGYILIIERNSAIAKPPPPQPAPTPPTSAQTTHQRPPFWRTKPFVAALFVLAGGLIVAWWFSHNGHCGAGLQITSHRPGDAVKADDVIGGTRFEREWLCRCKDYLVVQPLEKRVWYVQDRLLNGPDWSAGARFGDADTPSGTEFNVFVISTTANLPRGALDPSSTLFEDAKQSRSIRVVLRRPPP